MKQSGIGQLIDGIQRALGDIQVAVLAVAGSVIVLMLIIGGYQYIMGQKDAGKKTITAALIGLIIIMLAAVLVGLANSLF